MTVLTTCLSGLFAASLLAADPVGMPMDRVPETCPALMEAHWHLDATVTYVDGRKVGFDNGAGCSGDLEFTVQERIVRVGDRLRIHGVTLNGEVIITRVERRIEQEVGTGPSSR